jgi:hypothetical protein
MLWGVRYHMGVLCDPIFWVVCWLLIGSPTAVQLTQITQLNCVFESEMATVRSPPKSPRRSFGLFSLLWFIGANGPGFMVGLRSVLCTRDHGLGHWLARNTGLGTTCCSQYLICEQFMSQ